MAVLLANDTISGHEGTVTATVNGRVRVLAEIKAITATMTKNKTEVRTLGRRGVQHKASGWTGTGSVTYHYMTSRWAEILREYAKTGEDLYFTMTVTNADIQSRAGSQRVTLMECNINSADILKIDVNQPVLEASFNFTFSDFDIIQSFRPIN